MAALSKTTGVPVPTIKFYLREGLLPAGQRTSPNQSQYDESHVHRLALIRGLTEVGGLTLAAVADILGAVDDPGMLLHDVFGVVQRTVTRQIASLHPVGSDPEFQLVDHVMQDLGWQHPDNVEHRQAAATLLTTMDRLGFSHTVASLRAYAAAAQIIAEVDIEGLHQQSSRDQMIQSVATTTILGDALAATFRRMAQTAMSAQHVDTQRFGHFEEESERRQSTG